MLAVQALEANQSTLVCKQKKLSTMRFTIRFIIILFLSAIVIDTQSQNADQIFKQQEVRLIQK